MPDISKTYSQTEFAIRTTLDILNCFKIGQIQNIITSTNMPFTYKVLLVKKTTKNDVVLNNQEITCFAINGKDYKVGDTVAICFTDEYMGNYLFYKNTLPATASSLNKHSLNNGIILGKMSPINNNNKDSWIEIDDEKIYIHTNEKNITISNEKGTISIQGEKITFSNSKSNIVADGEKITMSNGKANIELDGTGLVNVSNKSVSLKDILTTQLQTMLSANTQSAIMGPITFPSFPDFATNVNKLLK